MHSSVRKGKEGSMQSREKHRRLRDLDRNNKLKSMFDASHETRE